MINTTDKLAERLRVARAREHLKLRELSEICGVSIATISRAENGSDILASKLVAIANALGISCGDLLAERGER